MPALQIPVYLLSLPFVYWPLTLIIALTFFLLKKQDEFQTIIKGLLVCWGVICLCGVSVLISVQMLIPLPKTPIPEPLSTILFFITGIVLIAIKIAWRDK